jgi:hypothetical protein
VIDYEDSKLPYHGHQFRRMWRIIADKAGVPKTVKNMDSRPRKAVTGTTRISRKNRNSNN